jgi:hypothetical protein
MKLFVRIAFSLKVRGILKKKKNYNSITPRTLKSQVQDMISTIKFVFPKHNLKKRLLCQIISKQ